MSRLRAPTTAMLLVLACGCARVSAVEPPPTACTTTREFFARQIWAPFMSTVCFKCHAPDGIAVVKHDAKLVLQPPSYPGFLDRNLKTLRGITRIEYDGVPELLLKPIGLANHGGHAPLKADDPRYGALKELVRRLQQPETCAEAPLPTTLPGVEQLDAQATFRKAALDLGGRLPTTAEKQSLVAGGDTALDQALDELMKEDTFFIRLREIFNDVLLTDKFRWRGHPAAIQQLNPDEYPAAGELKKEWDDNRWAKLPEDQKRGLNDALAREPLNLIAWVARNDRPFSEILTADYAVVDDDLARLYGVHDGRTGLRQAQIVTATGVRIPHAGILTTPMFLNRITTTPTNRSRGRARFVLKTFLATDILKIADRPIDVAAVTKVDNPTMNAESCVVCHRIIDPIAGNFRGWDEHDYERFQPEKPWHNDMVHPGFGSLQLPAEDYGKALQWLAQQIVHDARFDRSMTQLVFTAMTGREPLPYPTANDPDFEANLRAWEMQDAFLRAAATRFSSSNRNVKALFKAVIESPYYRATRATGLSGEQSIEAAAFGTARLLTPEMLDRKIVAVTGIHWRKPWDWQKPFQDWLAEPGMQILFGGIDSDTITARATAVNGLMSNLIQRMANETACLAVPYDFSLPPEQRALMKSVQLDEVPYSAGHPVDGAIRNIRANIQALHERLLGERLADDDPELEATYQLFIDTWRDGIQSQARKAGLHWPCGLNPVDGSKLDEDIRADADYTERAWMAVVAYLLSDPRFVYE